MSETANDLPSLSVRRPYTAIVLNLLIIIAGISALMGVEIRELPNIDRPIVSVRANYPGGSPETIDAELTSVLERAVARVAGVTSVRSSSEEGNLRIRIEFNPSVDLIDAANEVREAVSRAERSLPEGVEDVSVIKADADASSVLQLAVTSRSVRVEEVTRLVEDVIIPELLGVEGVADVPMFGDRERVLRVVVDPNRLSSHGLSIRDVATLLTTAKFDVPAGSFNSGQQEVLVRANASVTQPSEIKNMLLKTDVRLGEVAQVYFSPADETSRVRLNGQTVVSLGIVRQAKSNTVAISQGVRAAVDGLNAQMKDVSITITSDDAVFIEGAIQEVVIALLMSVAIVILVLWLFFGRFSVTLIPTVVIPVALVGAVALIWMFGFSINLITLLALVLATGLVVDDAIVVVENIQRCQAMGMAPRAAAVIGTRQVFFAVLATTATLIAVFVPISFLPSTAGRLFREFGFMMAVTVGISSFVALSLCPMIASRLTLASPEDADRRRSILERIGGGVLAGYRRLLDAALAAPVIVVAASCALGIAALLVYQALPEELVPEEDRGLVTVRLSGPDGISLDNMDQQMEKAEAVFRPLLDDGTVTSLYSITGRYDFNRGQISAPLKRWEERDRTQQQIAAELRPGLDAIPGATARVTGGNSLGLRSSSGSSLSFALTGPTYIGIAAAADKFIQTAEREIAGISNLRLEYQATQPQISLQIDRERATNLNVAIEDLSSTLRVLVDGYRVSELTVDDQAVPVFLQSAEGSVMSPSDLGNIYVRAQNGNLIPLIQMISFKQEGIAGELNRNGQRRAIEVDGDLADDLPLRDAVEALRALAATELPPDINLLMLGEAATLEETSNELAMTFAIALLVVFLVLVAQFESLTSALVVIITVPFGIAAAIFALAVTGISINIYSQIGVLLLIGIMAKNGILMVEFADQLRDQGKSVVEAAREASLVRLRAIAMTMLSTMIGGLPLILSSGPGSESRTSIGWVIFGGLAFAAVFTLFLTPAVYTLVARMSKPRITASDNLADEMKRAEQLS